MINFNVTGTQGAQGANGSQGVQGVQGAQGLNGEAGSNGAQGHQGYIGTSGSIGTQGFQGSIGNSGSDGANVTYETVGDSSVSLLLHMEGANNSTTFTDKSYSAKTVTGYGNAKISTADYKFGSSSCLLDGSGDYLRIPYNTGFDLSSGDFTVEGWVNPSSIPASGVVIFGKHQSGVAIDYEFSIKNSTTLMLATPGVVFTERTVPTITTGTWHHFAVTRSSGTLRIFWNGVQAGATASLTISNSTSLDLVIGASSFNIPAAFFNGYIDEIRFTKGIARYTSNFTPSASAFSNADEYSSLPASASVGQTVYSSAGIYVCSSASPLVWKKYAVSPSTITF